MSRCAAAFGLASLVLSFSGLAAAQVGSQAVASPPYMTFVALGAFSLLPLLFMATTSFVKISVVFSILRNALGTGQVPSALVLTALSAILTLYVMAPVGEAMVGAALPAAEEVDRDDPLADLGPLGEAFSAGVVPLRDFLHRNAGERERALFLDLAREARADAPAGSLAGRELDDRDLLVLLPAFLVTELSEAFQIGFLVFLPFLIVDLIISNILMSLGMHSLNPNQVSLPFKLLLFVLVDGWYLLSRALVLGYG